MALTALQSPPQTPQQYHARTKWCEIGQHGPRQTVVPLHEQSRVTLQYRVKLRFETKFLPLASCAAHVYNERFGDEARSKLKAVKPLPFEVTVNRVVSRDYRLPALAVVGGRAP
jgi:hypothetical protein